MIFAVPLTAVAVFVVYAVWLPALYFTSLWRVLIARPPGLSAPGLQPKTRAGADPAVLQYFYGPALADADQAIRDARGSGREFWQRGVDAIRGSFTGEGAVWRAPFGAGGAIGMVAGTAVGAVATAALALIQLAAIGVTAGLARLAAPRCAASTRSCCGSRTSAWSVRAATSGSPTPGTNVPGRDARGGTGTSGLAGSASCAAAASAGPR